MRSPYVSADHRDALIVMAGDGMEELREENKRLKQALRHIGYETLTTDMEASERECLTEAVRIAREALR